MKIIHGNILTPNTDDKSVIVCHQVNCRGLMGAGLALQIRRRFPMVYEVYRDKCTCHDKTVSILGDVQFVSVLDEAGYIIANVFSQDNCGRYGVFTDYDAMTKAFRKIAEAFHDSTIRIPYRMGCGLGGGDWWKVEDIIQKTLCNAGVDVEVWVYQ